jgi:hypothetical protein
MGKSLEILAERSGAAIIGLLAEDVFYLGFVGHVTSGLASKCASRMTTALAGPQSAHCFFNAQLADTFDFSARSTIVRTALATRRHIASMTTLVRKQASTATAQAIVVMLDGEGTIVADANAFDTMLVKAAPLAHMRLREIELTSLQGSARWRSSFLPDDA